MDMHVRINSNNVRSFQALFTCMKSGRDSNRARLHRVSLEGTSAAGRDRPASLKALEKGKDRRKLREQMRGCEGKGG